MGCNKPTVLSLTKAVSPCAGTTMWGDSSSPSSISHAGLSYTFDAERKESVDEVLCTSSASSSRLM